MPEHAPKRLVTFTRADGNSIGKAYLEECEPWVQTKFGGSKIGQDIWDLYQSNPEAWEGEPPPPPTPTAPIDTMRFHHGNIEPTLYHSPQGDWFRRLWWDEYEGGGLSTARRYIGLSEEQAHEWLRFNGYDVPESTQPTAKSDVPVSLRDIDQRSTLSPAIPGDDFKYPSVDELSKVLKTFIRLNAANTHTEPYAWKQEDLFLPSFCHVADALRSIRPNLDSIDGWPPVVGHAIRSLVRIFDTITESWGWERVAAPEPERTTYLEDRRDWFAENVARPRYEAALSGQDRDGFRCPSHVSQAAIEGWRLGYKPALPHDQVNAAWDEADTKWEKIPRFGNCFPRITSLEVASLATPINQIDYILKCLPPRPVAPVSEAAPPEVSPEPAGRDVLPLDDSPKQSIQAKATGAAYDLRRLGKRVSIAAVAKQAGVNRSYLYHYPEITKLIKTMNTPDRHKPKGSKDRDGNLEAQDDFDEE